MKKPFVFFWAGVAGVIIFSWVYLPTLSKYRDLKQQQEDLEKQVKKLAVEIEKIREERDLLKNDPEYLEKVIRQEMGLVKPGEIVYKFVPDQPKASPSPLTASDSPSPSPVLTPSPSPTPAIVVEAKRVLPRETSRKQGSASTNREPEYPRKETR